MTKATATVRADPVTIRAYRPLDHRACRSLWAELVESERELYDDPRRGGTDPGAGFEEYLTRLDLAGMWVAEDPEEGIVGMVGLVLGDGAGRGGEVAPIVVTDRLRDRGIGRTLLNHVAQEAGHRGMTGLSITPDSRNVEGIRCFHAAGYQVLSSITLTLDLAPRDHEWRDGLDVHHLRFSY